MVYIFGNQIRNDYICKMELEQQKNSMEFVEMSFEWFITHHLNDLWDKHWLFIRDTFKPTIHKDYRERFVIEDDSRFLKYVVTARMVKDVGNRDRYVYELHYNGMTISNIGIFKTSYDINTNDELKEIIMNHYFMNFLESV